MNAASSPFSVMRQAAERIRATTALALFDSQQAHAQRVRAYRAALEGLRDDQPELDPGGDIWRSVSSGMESCEVQPCR